MPLSGALTRALAPNYAHLTPEIRRKAVLTDRLNVFLAIVLLAFALGNAASGFPTLAMCALALSLATVFLIRLGRSGSHERVARVSIIAANAYVFIYAALLGPQTRLQNIFFFLIGLPLLTQGPSRKPGLVLETLLPIALYAILERTGFTPFGPLFGIWGHVPTPGWDGRANTLIAFLLSFLSIFYLHRLHARMQAELHEKETRLLAAAKLSALGEVVGGIAHEINNPLATIQLTAGQIKTSLNQGVYDSTRLIGHAERIQSTVFRISRIVRALNTFVRDTDHDPMSLDAIGRIVHDAGAICQDKVQAHGIRFEIDEGPEGLRLHCNAVQIAQIVINLINNSCDAIRGTPSPWIRIEIADRGGAVEVSVTDSGRGIRGIAREKLFQPFFTTKRAGEGTGLGLSVSTRIAQAHHGELALDDQCPNTRFVLILPKAQPALAAGLARSQGAQTQAPGGSRGLNS